MSDPFEVLGLPTHADETAIRQKYLELVRANPPDRAPERFAEIRRAYDEIRDPARRLEARLFDTVGSDSLDAIEAELRAHLTARRLPVDVLLTLADHV